MAAVRPHRPMASSLDAIEVVLTLLDHDPRTTLVALVDQLPGGAGAVLPVDGGDPGPAGVTQLASLVAEASPVACNARLVLVSVRHHGGASPAESDLAAWRHLVRSHRTGPLELLDWFVVTDEAILSLAELAGPPARWAG